MHLAEGRPGPPGSLLPPGMTLPRSRRARPSSLAPEARGTRDPQGLGQHTWDTGLREEWGGLQRARPVPTRLPVGPPPLGEGSQEDSRVWPPPSLLPLSHLCSLCHTHRHAHQHTRRGRRFLRGAGGIIILIVFPQVILLQRTCITFKTRKKKECFKNKANKKSQFLPQQLLPPCTRPTPDHVLLCSGDTGRASLQLPPQPSLAPGPTGPAGAQGGECPCMHTCVPEG